MYAAANVSQLPPPGSWSYWHSSRQFFKFFFCGQIQYLIKYSAARFNHAAIIVFSPRAPVRNLWNDLVSKNETESGRAPSAAAAERATFGACEVAPGHNVSGLEWWNNDAIIATQSLQSVDMMAETAQGWGFEYFSREGRSHGAAVNRRMGGKRVAALWGISSILYCTGNARAEKTATPN